MHRIRIAFWELVAGILGAISSAIMIVEKLYAHRRLLRGFAQVVRKTIFPIIIASMIVTTVWLRSQVDQTTLWNFPPFSKSPFPHLSLYAAPLLDNLVYSWLGSLAFSIIYSNRNRLGRRSWLWELSYRFMRITLVFYPGLVLWFSTFAELSFLIPSWAQTPLWLGSAYPLGQIIFRSVEVVIDRRIFGKQGLVSIAIDKAIGVASIGMRSIGVGVYGNVRYVSYRVRGKPVEVIPNPNVKPTIGALFLFLTIGSMTAAYGLGYTSMLALFYAFGVAPYSLAIAAGIVGWRKLKQEEEEKKRVVRVPRRFRSKFRFFTSVICNLFSEPE